jgi:hypothetical protein
VANMLRKSKTLGYAACPCIQCNRENGKGARKWRRAARRKEARVWQRDAGIRTP